MKTARFAIGLVVLVASAALAAQPPKSQPSPASASQSTSEPPLAVTASYTEVPYYLNKLQETQIDGERLRLNKIIHDAIVTADLSDKKVVKEMEPIIAKVQVAISTGLDRPYLEGESTYLASAVNFFEKEKLHPVVDVPELDWAQPQTTAKNGFRISTFPDRILLHEGDKTRTATESSNIHEAVISPDGRRIAYFRTSDDGSQAELWEVETKKLHRKKIATMKSCLTLLFTADGDRILFQEVPDGPNAESALYSVSPSWGKPKEIAQVRLLQTNVEKGKYKGDVVVYKAMAHPMGTTIRDCAAIISPSGKDIGRTKDGPCR